MITLSAAQKQYLMDDDYRVEMEVNTVNEDDITITEADLVQGSFSGNRFSCVGNTIEIGSANAAEISFTLRNDDGTFDDVVFEGAQVIVWLRRGNAGSYTLNLRLFTARVDEVRHAIDSIQLVLLDSMVKLDRTAANLTYNTPQGVIQQICSACGITYNSTKSSLVNGTVALATPTTEDLSYRQVLMWIAQITGTCAFIDPEDKLVLGWYTEDASIDDIDFITKSNRFSSDLDENEIVVTGVSATVGETTYQSKDDSVDVDYLIAIEGNELINETNVTTILAGLFNRVNGFGYTPFSATTMNMCWLQPLDMTEFMDKDDNPHMVIITDWTFTPHSSLQLAGKGESATRKGYASNPPFTAQQSRIIEKLKRDVENVDVDDRITAVLGLNDAINHGMMLHSTTIDGKEYRHNAALISDSTYICTANSGGFAWTNSGWNDGDPVWEYGISSDGSAVLEHLSAYAISADVVSTGILQSTDGSTTLDMNNGTASFFNGALLYDSVHGFRFGTNVTFGVGNLGQDVLNLIEQGSDGIDVHATAGTLSTNNYPLTTTEQVTELTEGQTVEITFPNGIDFSLNTSGNTYLYKPRTVSIGNNTYTLLNANGTTDWCNVKDSSNYSSDVTVKFIARTISNTLKLCELIEAENVLDEILETDEIPTFLEPTEAITNPTSGTVLRCNVSQLTYGMAITSQTSTPSHSNNPRFSWNRADFQPLLSKSHYSDSNTFGDAYSSSELYRIGSTASTDYVGESSTAGSTRTKQVSNITPSGFSLVDGVTISVTFTYGNTGYQPLLKYGTGSNDYANIFYERTESGGIISRGYLRPTDPENWSDGETVQFRYYSNFSDFGAGFVVIGKQAPTYYFTPKTEDEPTGVSSVNVILENLRTSSGTELRAFELRYEPYSTAPMAIDQEARDAADRALLAALAAQTSVSDLDSDVDSRISDAIAGITVEGTITTFYGTCSTAASTAAKVVSTDSSFALTKGAIINVKFDNANTGDYPTLNVNSTVAKDIYVSNARLRYGASQATNPYNWTANAVVQFMYNGSVWIMSQTSADLILGKWCANNDITMINGGKIATGSIAADSIVSSSITATQLAAGAVTAAKLSASDAMLANLLAKNAEITGELKFTSLPHNADYYAQYYYNKNYSALSDAQKVFIAGQILSEVTYSAKIKAYLLNANTPTMYLTSRGLIVNINGVNESTLDSNSYYMENARVAGNLTVGGTLTVSGSSIPKIDYGTSPISLSSDANYTSISITFNKTFSTPPSVTATAKGPVFAYCFVNSVTTTGCTIYCANPQYNTYNIDICWQAIGT